MSLLLPRIPAADSRRLMEAVRGLPVPQVAEAADAFRESAVSLTFASTGGRRLTAEDAARLKADVRGIAAAYGYPLSPTLDGQQRFDRDVALYLFRLEGLQAGEAIRAEWWQYMSAFLLPDVVMWRFPPSLEDQMVTESRYLGGNRNCFGRLWHRAFVLLDERLADPSLPLSLLREDNFVALLERSAFATYPGPCREIARGFLLRRPLCAGRPHGHGSEQDLLRDAMTRFIRLSAHVAMWAMDQESLRACVSQALDASLRAFEISPKAETELLRNQPELLLRGEPRPEVAAANVYYALEQERRVPAPRQVLEPGPRVDPRSDRPLPFAELDDNSRAQAVWEVLLGKGEHTIEAAIRTAAHALRARGVLVFERLREGGSNYLAVEAAIERGVRLGLIDRPSRGFRRALARGSGEVPESELTSRLKGRLSEGLPDDLALTFVTADVCQLFGVTDSEDLRSRLRAVLTRLRAGGAQGSGTSPL